jgi:hypothetical protein
MSNPQPKEHDQMRKLLFAGLVALLVPTASHAQIQLGLRLGYGSASGDMFKVKGPGGTGTISMSDSVKSAVPLQLDANYKFDKDWSAGVYLSYGFGQANQDNCAGSCSASTFGAGVQGFYTFNQVTGPFVPWAGIGLGYTQASWGDSSGTLTASGVQGSLQVGGDYKVNEQFSVGPYLSYAYGQFSSYTLPAGVTMPAGVSTDTASHSWLGLGIVGKFNL